MKQTVIRLLRQNSGLVAGNFSILLAGNFLNILLPLSIGLFYEIVLHETGPKSRMMHWLPIDISSPFHFLCFFAGLVAAKTGLTYLEKYWTGILGERFSRELRESLFSTQLHHSLEIHRQRPVGKYLLRYSGDLNAIQRFVSKGILVFAGDAIFLLCAFATLYSLQSELAMVALAVFLLAGATLSVIGIKVRQITQKRRDQRSRNLAFVSSRMHAFYTLKSFNREKPEINRFNRLSRKLYLTGLRYSQWSAIVEALFPLFFFGAIGIVLLTVTKMRTQAPPGIASGDVLIFVLMLLYMRSVMKRLTRVNIIWQSGRVSFEKLRRILQQPVEYRGKRAEKLKVEGVLTLENVSFSLHASKPVLEHLNLRFDAHSTTWVQGPQGSGKSTLLKLIQKMYLPDSGVIRLDDLNYNDLTAFDIRRQVALVSDEAPLVGDTVLESLIYRASDAKYMEAATLLKRLKVSFVTDPAVALNYRLDEQGRNLSAGDRMLLQLARAILTRKKILLLDEPFQHLDAPHRQIAVEILNKLKSKRTIILVSDRCPDGLFIDQSIVLSHEA